MRKASGMVLWFGRSGWIVGWRLLKGLGVVAVGVCIAVLVSGYIYCGWSDVGMESCDGTSFGSYSRLEYNPETAHCLHSSEWAVRTDIWILKTLKQSVNTLLQNIPQCRLSFLLLSIPNTTQINNSQSVRKPTDISPEPPNSRFREEEMLPTLIAVIVLEPQCAQS